MKKMFEEFKKFIMRGNVLDMAVGVIVGGAFKEIVNSLVADIFTPVISLFTGGVDFSTLHWVIKTTETVDATTGETIVEELAVNYGAFIQNIFDFLLVALCVFLFVEIAQTIRTRAEALAKKQEEEAAAEPEPEKPSNEEILLTEIRDLLKGQAEKDQAETEQAESAE